MPRGGFRPNAGRKRGSRNRRLSRVPDDRELPVLARAYSEEALDALVDIMRHSKKLRARVRAAILILNWGYGRSPIGSPEDLCHPRRRPPDPAESAGSEQGRRKARESLIEKGLGAFVEALDKALSRPPRMPEHPLWQREDEV